MATMDKALSGEGPKYAKVTILIMFKHFKNLNCSVLSGESFAIVEQETRLHRENASTSS